MFTNKLNPLVFAVIFFAGCATSFAPTGWLPEVEELQQDSHGGWLTVTCLVNYSPMERLRQSELNILFQSQIGSEGTYTLGGEFITTSNDTVYLLTTSGFLYSLHHNQIVEATLDLYNKSTNTFRSWTILGTISTFSHGLWLISTAPLWLITGIANTSGESYRDRWSELLPTSDWWLSLRKYSRFPQGMPEGLDRSKLITKR